MYKIKNKKKFFQNEVYKAYTNNVIKNDTITKKFLTLEVINKFKDIGGVSCLVIDNKNKIGLMKVLNPFTKKKYYTVIQGFLGNKEKPLQSIKRELQEEVGIIIKQKDVKKLCDFYPILSLISTKMSCFYLKIKKKTVTNKNLIEDEVGIDNLIYYEKKK